MTARIESTHNEGLEEPSDEKLMASLYAECAEDDRELSEKGISDYAETLAKEDDLRR